MGDIISSESEKYSIPVIRSDKNSIYPRNSRLLRWLEMCAEWCCGGWEKSTRYRHLAICPCHERARDSGAFERAVSHRSFPGVDQRGHGRSGRGCPSMARAQYIPFFIWTAFM